MAHSQIKAAHGWPRRSWNKDPLGIKRREDMHQPKSHCTSLSQVALLNSEWGAQQLLKEEITNDTMLLLLRAHDQTTFSQLKRKLEDQLRHKGQRKLLQASTGPAVDQHSPGLIRTSNRRCD